MKFLQYLPSVRYQVVQRSKSHAYQQFVQHVLKKARCFTSSPNINWIKRINACDQKVLMIRLKPFAKAMCVARKLSQIGLSTTLKTYYADFARPFRKDNSAILYRQKDAGKFVKDPNGTPQINLLEIDIQEERCRGPKPHWSKFLNLDLTVGSVS